MASEYEQGSDSRTMPYECKDDGLCAICIISQYALAKVRNPILQVRRSRHLTAGLDSIRTSIWLEGFNNRIYIFAGWTNLGTLQDEKSFIGSINKIEPWDISFSHRGSSRLPPPLIQDWLKDCEFNHAMMCRPQNDQKPSSMILIDVMDNCLIAVPVGTSHRYFALSYVWGGVKMLQTTMSNIELLKRPGALLDHTAYIPNVIGDAISLVLSLNERYLWVDSLCIVQDDTAVKHLQLTEMNLIYNQAMLVISAISCTNAHDKLPGVQNNSRVPSIV